MSILKPLKYHTLLFVILSLFIFYGNMILKNDKINSDYNFHYRSRFGSSGAASTSWLWFSPLPPLYSSLHIFTTYVKTAPPDGEITFPRAIQFPSNRSHTFWDQGIWDSWICSNFLPPYSQYNSNLSYQQFLHKLSFSKCGANSSELSVSTPFRLRPHYLKDSSLSWGKACR